MGMAEDISMHRILCRNALDQGLFFYVQGAVRSNPSVSIPVAVMDFCETFGLTAESDNMRRKYYRMLKEYRTDNTDFRDNLNYTIEHESNSNE